MAALLGAHIIKVKPPRRASTWTRPRGLREARCRWTRWPSAIAHVVQACFAGRRIVVFSGGEAKGTEGVLDEIRADPRRRRQRLDHRPQQLPAAEGARRWSCSTRRSRSTRAGVSRRRRARGQARGRGHGRRPVARPGRGRARGSCCSGDRARGTGTDAWQRCPGRSCCPPSRPTRCSGPPAAAIGCPCCCAGTSPRPVTAVPTGCTSPGRTGGGGQGAAGSRLPDRRLLRPVAARGDGCRRGRRRLCAVRLVGVEPGAEVEDLVAWWSELFVLPCAAAGRYTVESARAMAARGADFLATQDANVELAQALVTIGNT